MNRHIARALVQDALYQVLDNKIFRLLIIVAIVLIAPTLLISFGESEVSVLFGWKVFSYHDLGWLMQGVNPSSKDAQIRAIQSLQSLVVESLAGNFGILFCLAATAFFVPRMLEKGEADTLFSKPVGRFVLLFSRYVSGILFVGVLAFVLILGMHLGLLLRSGYSDPGFLWGAVTLVYTFAIVHAVSTFVGVFTRSSVMALLCSILFFGVNGCFQGIWIQKEHFLAQTIEARDAGEDNELANSADDYDKPLWRFLFGTLNTIHYVLPKTSDADVLTRKLRVAITGGQFVLEDRVGQLALDREPADMVRAESKVEVDTAMTPVVWTPTGGQSDRARITLTRHSRLIERKIGEKAKTGRTSSNAAASDWMKSLETRKDLEGKPVRIRDSTLGAASNGVRWQVKEDGQTRLRVRHFVAVGDWMHEVELTCDPAWLDARPNVFVQFLAGFKPQREMASELPATAWYEKRFGWSSPLKFNAFFSLGSSILFAAVLMLLARWRLSRIDF